MKLRRTRCTARGPRSFHPEDLALSYVLPLASPTALLDDEFVDYLERLASRVDLVVVDGSPPDVFLQHKGAWGKFGRHVAPLHRTAMGKVGGVLTGIALAKNDRIVIADDDVRYDDELFELGERLKDASVVRPQNYFDPLPWHAVLDSGRILLNRTFGGDWPGTLGVRRTPELMAIGYPGDVLFENFELCRTIEALGGKHRRADDIFVRRLPPSTAHFLGQRVRQAYDELARPWRLTMFLSLIPGMAWLARSIAGRRALRFLVPISITAIVVLAEVGRNHAGARRYFPFRCAVLAPLWVVERSCCSWIAFAAWMRGGVRYRGTRLRRSARRPAERRQAVQAVRRSSLESTSRCKSKSAASTG